MKSLSRSSAEPTQASHQFKRAIAAGIICCVVALARLNGSELLSGESQSAQEAHALIDAALDNRRKLASYTTVSVREQGRGVERTVRYVKNMGSPVQLLREERSYALPHLAPKTATLVQNFEGIWQEHNGTVLHITFPFRSERPIARRLTTAQLLCRKHNMSFDEAKHLRVQLDPDYEHFGIPCIRIVIGLAPEITALLQRDITESQQVTTGPEPAPEHEHNTYRPADLPTSYVYHIAKGTPFVLLFQSYSIAGEKTGEVSCQEFQPLAAIPDSTFARPTGTNVVEISNREELAQAMRSLQGAKAAVR